MRAFALIVYIISCHCIDAQQSKINSSLDLYPLHIGNYWQYEVTRKYLGPDTTWIGYREVIDDTLLANGKRYYKVVESQLPGSYALGGQTLYTHRTVFIRVDSLTANVYELHLPFDEEYLIDSLAAEIGDTVNTCYLCVEDTSKTILGLDTRTRLINKYCIGGDEDGWELASDIGEVMRYYADIYVNLIYYESSIIFARVNGIEYGQLTSTNSNEPFPASFKLDQNFPNPFNPTTTIKYSLSSKEFVQLRVYDVLGNLISILINEEKNIGNYTFNFNAIDISSGVYFYCLQAGNNKSAKKMLLLK